jgi:hypothetical protein
MGVLCMLFVGLAFGAVGEIGSIVALIGVGAIGYIQWFIVVPWLSNAYQRKSAI